MKNLIKTLGIAMLLSIAIPSTSMAKDELPQWYIEQLDQCKTDDDFRKVIMNHIENYESGGGVYSGTINTAVRVHPQPSVDSEVVDVLYPGDYIGIVYLGGDDWAYYPGGQWDCYFWNDYIDIDFWCLPPCYKGTAVDKKYENIWDKE